MILQVAGLSFHYASSPVIRDTHFSVGEGEILTILGPNGEGKTTLLKCLNRVLTPQSGSVFVDGADLEKMSVANIARRVSWVPQHNGASRMKVYDLILLGRKPHFSWGPGAEDHFHVNDAMRLLEIEHLALRYADELSGGELQLVQIARALAQEPRVILFDEPTSSLDISHQHRLMPRIQSIIHGEKRAAVMTMHDINLALRYSDKFLLLQDGRVNAMGGREIINDASIEEVYGMKSRIVEVAGYPVVVPV